MTSRLEHRRQMQAGIFDAAIRLFDLHGYDDTSVEEICAEAGVGRATFFRYYETKSGLIREIDRRVAAQVRRQQQERDDPSFSALLQIVADVLYQTWAHPGNGLRAVGRESTSVPRPSRRVFAYTLEVVVETTTQALERDDLDSALPPQLIGYVALMQLTSAVGWWLDNPDNDLRALLAGIVQHTLSGYPARNQRGRQDPVKHE